MSLSIWNTVIYISADAINLHLGLIPNNVWKCQCKVRIQHSENGMVFLNCDIIYSCDNHPMGVEQEQQCALTK